MQLESLIRNENYNYLTSVNPQRFYRFEHVYMNLPKIAIDFVDVFSNWAIYRDQAIWKPQQTTTENPTPIKYPILHVYCFQRGVTTQIARAKVVQRIQAYLGQEFQDSDIVSFRKVKDIGLNHNEYAVAVQLRAELCSNQQISEQIQAIINKVDKDMAEYEKMTQGSQGMQRIQQ